MSGVGTRLLLGLGSGAGKERCDGGKRQNRAEVGQWGFRGGTSKNKSMAGGKIGGAAFWGLNLNLNTSHKETLSTSLERVREREMRLVRINVCTWRDVCSGFHSVLRHRRRVKSLKDPD